MALNNCTINTASFTKTGGQAIGSDNATLVITPNSGYVVSASNFTNNTGTVAGISSISLSDTGTAGTVGNTVSVAIDLDDNYVMPMANTTLTIDIDGDADLISYSLSGDYNTSITNATPSSETGTDYSATGNYNQQVTVFTKTFTANTGHYFPVAPIAQLVTGVSSNYDITHVNTTNSDGEITATTFTVKYTFPNNNVTGDLIVFRALAIEIPSKVVEITSYNIATGNILEQGEVRLYKVFGTPNASFSVTVVNSGGTTISSISNVTMPASGQFVHPIIFPEISTGSEVYTITITGDLADSFDTANGQSSSIDITQLSKVDLGFRITTTNSGITTPADQTLTLPAYDYEFGNAGKINLTFELTSSSNINLITPIDAADFTNQSSTDLKFDVTGVTITNNQSTSVNLNVVGEVWETSDVSLISVLDIDDYINIAPVANAVSFSVSKGQSTSVTLNGTDANGQSLTYYVVSLPSNGTLYSDSGLTTAITAGASITGAVVYYEHDDSNNLTDSFTYKVNDGFEDSNTATVSAVVGVSAGASIATSGGAGVYLVPLVVGTDAGTLKVHFNAQSVPDRFQILFDTAGSSNTLSDMEVVADSLYVGDSVSSTSPANGTTNNLDEYTYVGSGGDATGTGEPGAAWNKTGDANQSITVADTDVTIDATDRSSNPADTTSLGVSRNTSGTQTTQTGVQAGVFTSGSATSLTTGLDKKDGNICLYYTKSSTTAYQAYLKVFGPTSGTAWNVYKTEFSSAFGYAFAQASGPACSTPTSSINSNNLAYFEDDLFTNGKKVYINSEKTQVLVGNGNVYKFFIGTGTYGTVSSTGVLSSVGFCGTP